MALSHVGAANSRISRPRYRVRMQNRPLAPQHLLLIAAGYLALPPLSGCGFIAPRLLA